MRSGCCGRIRCRIQRADIDLARVRDYVLFGDGEKDDGAQDRQEEKYARYRRTKREAAIACGLGQIIAERGAERPSQNIGDPEGKNGVQAELEVGESRQRNERREDERRHQVAELKALGREVAASGAKRKRKQDRKPVNASRRRV